MALARQTLSGFVWTFASRMGTRFSIFVTGIILARLLSPAEFGLIAILSVFFAISTAFVESGFGSALIREKVITEQAKSTVFFVNLIISFLLYSALWFASPSISRFFNQPELLWLARFMGLEIIFHAFGIVQRSVLTHNLRFKLLASVEIIVSIVAGVIAILLAYRGMGVWALALKFVLSGFFKSLLLWGINPWKPKYFIHKSSFSYLFGFGSKLLLTGLLDRVFNNIYDLIIGKLYSPALLGLYNRAFSLSGQLVQLFLTPLLQVTYPSLSKTKEDPVRLKGAFKRIVASMSFVNFPLSVLLIFSAEPLILLLLGEKWEGAIPFLQILAAGALVEHISSINANLYKVIRRSDLVLKLSVINKIIICLAIIVGIQFGIWGLITGMVISKYIGMTVAMLLTSKNFHYTISEQIKDILPVILNAIPMAGMLMLILHFRIESNFLNLAVMGIFGGGTYVLTAFLSKSTAYREINHLLVPFIRKGKRN